jgi:hypothetical protein
MNRHRRVRNLVREHKWTPVDVNLDDLLYWDMRRWCEKTFDADTWDGSLRGLNGVKFVFARESDAMLFKLRWLT